MKALIIYDSFFGNTEQIAKAIGNSLATQADIKILRVNEVKPERLQGLDLLLVGSPTRAFKATAAAYNFINSIPRKGLKGVKTAAFDTRIPLADIHSSVGSFFIKRFGYAAGKIAKQLHKKGGDALVPPEGFGVKESEGPLKEGELLRAEQWAAEILNYITGKN